MRTAVIVASARATRLVGVARNPGDSLRAEHLAQRLYNSRSGVRIPLPASRCLVNRSVCESPARRPSCLSHCTGHWRTRKDGTEGRTGMREE